MAGQKQKKGKAGNAVQYMTRTQALRKLQLSLAQFRKLCIVKGIHPREPNKKSQGQHKTYYHIKDIHFLAHEPLIKKYREIAIHERKIRKARAKRNEDLARRLRTRKPTYKLDHLVKERVKRVMDYSNMRMFGATTSDSAEYEKVSNVWQMRRTPICACLGRQQATVLNMKRYPTFIDALRDLDDALTLVHLFATLPAEQKHRIPNSAVHTSRRLALEWQAYIVRTSSLRKTFVSVKGFYYQAEIMGQNITWLVPHQLSQVLPADVDYRVMCTFLEFYQTLLQFVNFKLYHTIGIQYPPVVDPNMEKAAAGLAAIMEDLAEPVKAAQPSGDKEIALTPDAQLRLQGLQDKLHDLQQQDRAEAAALEPDVQDKAAASELKDDHPVPEDESAEEAEAHEEVEDENEARRASHKSAGALVLSTGQSRDVVSMVGGAVAVEDDREICATLFQGFIFFLGREVPREQLLVVIRSFGGVVGWDGDGSPIDESSNQITHQICDRPKVINRREGRQYMQPQWVVDSANFRILVDARLYAPGSIPPPHLSPFVDAEEEGYIPDYLADLRKMQASAKVLRQRAQGIEASTAFLQGGEEPLDEGAREAAELAAAEKLFQKQLAKEIGEKRKADEAEVDESENDDTADEPQAGGGSLMKESNIDEEGMKKAMMTRKDRNLYQSILNRQKVKKQRVDRLEQRKAEISGGKKGSKHTLD